MRVTILVDNLAERGRLLAEHGFALHIETSAKRILFDTGASGTALVHNAQRLGIDLSLVDELVLSHGHSDHTGGLGAFLALNSRASIRMSPAGWVPKYKGREAYIGLPLAREAYEERVVPVEQPLWIAADVRVMTAAPILDQTDTHFEGMYVKEGQLFKQDEFQDELSLLIENAEYYGVVSACSHRGITNILEEATRLAGEAPAVVIAGMHLRQSSPEQIDPIVEGLASRGLVQFHSAHCSGPLATAMLRERMPGRVEWTSAGKVIEF